MGARTSTLTVRAGVLLGLWGTLVAGCDTKPTGSSPTGSPDVNGEWRSGASVYRLTTDGAKVSAVFVTVSPEAQALGFKAGDLSYEGTLKGPFIQGEQIIRYQAEIPCHRQNGRRAPFIAMVAADGRRIVIDWYNVNINPQTCQDVGRTIGVTLLERR
jgi:hypothetical protein